MGKSGEGWKGERVYRVKESEWGGRVGGVESG